MLEEGTAGVTSDEQISIMWKPTMLLCYYDSHAACIRSWRLTDYKQQDCLQPNRDGLHL